MAVSLVSLRVSLLRRSAIGSSVRFMTSEFNDDGGDKKAEAKRKLNTLISSFKESKKSSEAGSKKIELAKPNVAVPGTKEDVSGLEPEVVHAAHRVAHLMAESADEEERQVKIRKTESDLIKRLRSVKNETEEAKKESEVSLSSLVQNLKVEAEKVSKKNVTSKTENQSSGFPKISLTADEIKFLEKRRRQRADKKLREIKASYKSVDIFNAEPPLGIFSEDIMSVKDDKVILETWKKCHDREMKILSSMPPKNFLEDMANMTERGVMWHFPIDNEQGISDEEIEPFHQHVFLEQHLEPWCPKKGPLRHFMELICVGLSKNSHISAGRKLEHINWYRDYFGAPEHNDILRGSGAYD